MSAQSTLIDFLEKHADSIHPVVLFNETKDKVAALDISKSNAGFTEKIYQSTTTLSAFINGKLKAANATYLIGGYKELREMYRRSALFDKNLKTEIEVEEEPRSLHLGIDIWGPAGVPIFAPMDGIVHSYADNDNHGDYGATIILEHQLEQIKFYTLYGHLSTRDLDGLTEGLKINRGQEFAHFGPPEENGNWPPHLHFQIITDMGQHRGDFPGVCKGSESIKYLAICPDPDLILQLNKYL